MVLHRYKLQHFHYIYVIALISKFASFSQGPRVTVEKICFFPTKTCFSLQKFYAWAKDVEKDMQICGVVEKRRNRCSFRLVNIDFEMLITKSENFRWKSEPFFN